MEVFLLQDIAGVGKKNDLIVVGDGFALNCLLPNRMGLVATPTVRKRYSEQIKKRAEERERERQMQMNAAAALAGKVLQFQRKAAKNNKLYAAVSPDDIVEALKTQLGFETTADAIILEEHIKTIGSHSVGVKIADATQKVGVMVALEK